MEAHRAGTGAEITAAQCQESTDTPSLKGGLPLDEGPGVASHLAYLDWDSMRGPPSVLRLVPGQQGPTPLPARNWKESTRVNG